MKNQSMENQTEFKSNDFYLCACVLASGVRLKRVDWNGGKIATFVFDDPTGQAENTISSHWDRRLALPTRDLIEAIHELKTRIHSGV
jgi:hypothetical protein